MNYVSTLHHQIIEAAKVQFRADGNDLPFEQCLETQAAAICPEGVFWEVWERNKVWHLVITD